MAAVALQSNTLHATMGAKAAAFKAATMHPATIVHHMGNYHPDSGCGSWPGGNGAPCSTPLGPFPPVNTHSVPTSGHPVPTSGHPVPTSSHHSIRAGGCVYPQPIHLPGDMPPPIHLPPTNPHGDVYSVAPHHDMRTHVPNPFPFTNGVPGGVVNPFPVGVVHSNVGALPFK